MRKLLHRFGEDRLRPLVPHHDLPLLEYLLRQNRRRGRHQGDKKDNLLESDDEADEDEHDSGDDMDVAEGTSVKKYSAAQADYRIESRPKAKRSASAVDDRLPTSLTDLLEDQGRISGERQDVEVAGGSTTSADRGAAASVDEMTILLRRPFPGTLIQMMRMRSTT